MLLGTYLVVVKKALLLSTASEFTSRLINFFSVVIFARLLTPSELGVFIIASSIMILASEVKLLGTHTYIVREEYIDESKVAAALGLATIFSWGLAILLIASSTLISTFYNNSDLAILIIILASSFIFSPFTSTTSALLTREYKFGKLLVIQNLGPIFGLTLSIILINKDYSYFSLAWGQAIASFITLLLAFFVRPAGMKWLPKFKGTKSLARIGFYASFVNVFGRLELTVPDLILGKISTSTTVANFSRAIGLQVFIKDTLLSGLSKVSLPYMASLKREKKDIKESYIGASELTLGFVLPIILAATIASETLINLLFGPQWQSAINATKALGIWSMLTCLVFYSRALLFTLHAEKSLFFLRLFLLIILVISITSLTDYGLTYISYAFILIGILDLLITSYLLKHFISLSLVEYLVSIKKSVFITIICGLTSFLVQRVTSVEEHMLNFCLYMAILTPTWIISIYVLKHPLSIQITKFSKMMIKG